jgi:non-heme chloroperoxidase
MGYIRTRDNVDLYVKDWGSGRPVIMTHGWPLSSDTFDSLSMAVANAGFRAISYDRRGFGRSSQPWEGYDYDTLADDLAAVIDATNARDAAVLGFSMGGGEVARYMSRHDGAHVRHAVLVGSVVPYMLQTPSNPDGVPQAVFDGMTTGIRQDRPKFFAGFFKDFYGVGPLSHPVSADVIDWSVDVAMLAGLNATLGCAHAFATTDFRRDLSAIKVPTLIIHGTADKTVPIDISARKAAVGIAGSHLVEYDGAPHGLFASHADKLALDVLKFIAA